VDALSGRLGHGPAMALKVLAARTKLARMMRIVKMSLIATFDAMASPDKNR
jgi:hypothetical protein